MPALRVAELPTVTIGMTLGSSRWIPILQSRIDAFAGATEEHHWIHIGRACVIEGPFGTTPGHGCLTLGLASTFLEEIPEVEDACTVITDGADRARFPSPVPVDSQLRAVAEIVDVTIGTGRSQPHLHVTIERDDEVPAAGVAEVLFRYLAPEKS